MTQQDTTEKKKTRTARPHENIKQKIPDELVILAGKTRERIDKNFVSFVRKQDRPDVEVLHMHVYAGEVTDPGPPLWWGATHKATRGSRSNRRQESAKY